MVVSKLQDHLFSELAIEKLLSLYRKRLAARRKSVPVDDGRLRKRLDEEINRQIDQGAQRVLSAPEKLVSTIYAKLDKLPGRKGTITSPARSNKGRRRQAPTPSITKRSKRRPACSETCVKPFPGCRAGGGSGVAGPVGRQG